MGRRGVFRPEEFETWPRCEFRRTQVSRSRPMVGRAERRSPLLDFLFRNGCIRTQKKVRRAVYAWNKADIGSKRSSTGA